MVIVNSNELDKEVDLNKFKETLSRISEIENIKTGEVTDIIKNKKILIRRKSAEIFLLKKNY